MKKLSINENKFVLSTKIEKGVPVGLVASKHNNDYLYVLYENGKGIKFKNNRIFKKNIIDKIYKIIYINNILLQFFILIIFLNKLV